MSDAAISTSSRQIIGLDLLRFAAAVLVVAYHFYFAWWLSDNHVRALSGSPMFLHPAWSVTWLGFVGVQMFFSISGFVIAYSAESATAFRFARDRFARLWPGLFVCATLSLGIYLALDLLPGATVLSLYLREITLYPLGPHLDVVVWTLTVEVVFYAMIFVLVLARRFAAIGAVAAVMACISTGYQVGYSVLCGGASSGICGSVGHWSKPILLLLIEHGCFFAFGIVLWLWLCKGLPKVATGIIAMAGCLLQIAATTVVNRAFHAEAQLPVSAPALVWIAGILGLVLAVRLNGTMRARLSPRAVAWIRLAGLATYPLYLLHFTLGGAVTGLLMRSGFHVDVAIACAWMVVMLASFGIARFIEPVLQRIVRDGITRVVPRFAAGGLPPEPHRHAREPKVS